LDWSFRWAESLFQLPKGVCFSSKPLAPSGWRGNRWRTNPTGSSLPRTHSRACGADPWTVPPGLGGWCTLSGIHWPYGLPTWKPCTVAGVHSYPASALGRWLCVCSRTRTWINDWSREATQPLPPI